MSRSDDALHGARANADLVMRNAVGGLVFVRQTFVKGCRAGLLLWWPLGEAGNR